MPIGKRCDYDAIIAEAKKGVKYADIAKKYGISTGHAAKIANKAGVRRMKKEEFTPEEWDRFSSEWNKYTKLLVETDIEQRKKEKVCNYYTSGSRL